MKAWIFALGLVCGVPPAADEAISDAQSTARQQAAVFLGTAHDAHSLSLLWVLAYDADSDVRQAALDALQVRCQREPPAVCARLLRHFVDDTITEVGWTARDRLLPLQVTWALAGSDSAYKLDLLSRLQHMAGLPPAVAGQALRLLRDDSDAAVRQNAVWLLERTP